MAQQTNNTNPTIVVGVDGSEPSRCALAWAVRQATAVRAELLAVMAWHLPTLGYGAPVLVPDGYDFAADAFEALERTITEVCGDAPAVHVEPRVVEGLPAQALLEAAEGAALLVVGKSGHGGLAGMVLGSVSARCASHAVCPTVIVPPPAVTSPQAPRASIQ